MNGQDKLLFQEFNVVNSSAVSKEIDLVYTAASCRF